MNYYCKVCDIYMKPLSKFKHVKFMNHTWHKESIIRRYIFSNPDFDEIDRIFRKYVKVHNKKYENFEIICSLKLLTTRKRVRYINTTSNSDIVLKKSMLSEIDKKRHYFSRIIEMRISFISSIRNMTHKFYLKQPKPMCEIKLNKIIAENPKPINCLDRIIFHPLIRKYSNIPFNDNE